MSDPSRDERGQEASHPLLPVLRLAAPVEGREVSALLWAFFANFCLLGAWYSMRPLRETFGVRAGEGLANLFAGTFVSSLIFLPIYLALVTRFGRRALAPIFYHGSAACLLVFWLLFMRLDESGDELVGKIFFVWLSTYVLFAGSLFWSLLVDLHSSDEAKRLFGLIFAGGTAGGLVSSAVVGLVVGSIGTTHIFWIPIVLLELLVLCLWRLDATIRRQSRADESGEQEKAREAAPVGGNPLEGLKQVLRSPYLAGICAYMFFATFAGTVLYFEQKDIVRATVESDEARTALFSWMNFAVQSLTVVGQAFLTGRLIRRFGLVVGLVLLPLLYAGGLLVLGAAAVLPVIVVLQVLRRSMGYAIAKPSKEILFTVVGRDAKYKSKGFIDTVVYRGGDAISGFSYDGLRALGMSLSGVAFAAVPICLLWAALCVRLGRKQEQLADEQARAAAEPAAPASV